MYKRKNGTPNLGGHVYKARVVARDFTQVEDVHFHEVFSPIVKHSSIRILLAMEDLELHQLDV